MSSAGGTTHGGANGRRCLVQFVWRRYMSFGNLCKDGAHGLLSKLCDRSISSPCDATLAQETAKPFKPKTSVTLLLTHWCQQFLSCTDHLTCEGVRGKGVPAKGSVGEKERERVNVLVNLQLPTGQPTTFLSSVRQAATTTYRIYSLTQ